jgi:hypothetical protein
MALAVVHRPVSGTAIIDMAPDHGKPFSFGARSSRFAEGEPNKQPLSEHHRRISLVEAIGKFDRLAADGFQVVPIEDA